MNNIAASQTVAANPAGLALQDFVRALARRQARIDAAKLVAANDNQQRQQ